jgi:hypothetical protein
MHKFIRTRTCNVIRRIADALSTFTLVGINGDTIFSSWQVISSGDTNVMQAFYWHGCMPLPITTDWYWLFLGLSAVSPPY